VSAKRTRLAPRARGNERVHGLREISVLYEGRHEQILVKPPDLSTRGMFISTTRIFPEGAVLNLRFRLAHSGAEVQTRSEVRYCLPGVGVGVEFIGISPQGQLEIEREMEHQSPQNELAARHHRGTKRPAKRTRPS
jgi:hypothetical protein